MSSWGQQFSSGDHGPNRANFYHSGMRTCPSCGGTDIKDERHVAGCRHNGDGYGTEVYSCDKCDWSTSFQYDEAGDTYYYDAPRARVEEPKPVPKPLDETTIRKYLRSRKVLSSMPNGDQAVTKNLKLEGVSDAHIALFFEIANSPDVEEAIRRLCPPA